MESTTLLCSTITGSYPRDRMSANREWIIFIVIARRHCHIFHVGSWKLPFEPKHHGGLVWIKIFYSVDWTGDPWICVNCNHKEGISIFEDHHDSICELLMVASLLLTNNSMAISPYFQACCNVKKYFTQLSIPADYLFCTWISRHVGAIASFVVKALDSARCSASLIPEFNVVSWAEWASAFA